MLRALAEADRADVAVVGFDDVPDAAQYSPPLTTVRQDFDELGERAVAALADGIESGDDSAGVLTVPTTLVVRESSRA
jgi:DNA-binding LacI/PurR family transcriptional regulator